MGLLALHHVGVGDRGGENDDGKRESCDRERRGPGAGGGPPPSPAAGSPGRIAIVAGPARRRSRKDWGTRGVGKPPLGSCGAFSSVTGVRPVTLKVSSGEESANCPFTFPERPTHSLAGSARDRPDRARRPRTVEACTAQARPARCRAGVSATAARGARVSGHRVRRRSARTARLPARHDAPYRHALTLPRELPPKNLPLVNPA